jgi:hypothetical protein
MQTWEVIGPHVFEGHEPGAVFEAEYTEERAAQLEGGGHIRKVTKTGKQPVEALRATAVAAGIEGAESMRKAELEQALAAPEQPATIAEPELEAGNEEGGS